MRCNPHTKRRAITKLTEALRWEFGAENEYQDKLTKWESVSEKWRKPITGFSTQSCLLYADKLCS